MAEPEGEEEVEVDQDALAAAWDAHLSGEDVEGEGDEEGELSAQWAAMIDNAGFNSGDAKGAASRVINQDEIDNLLGFNLDEAGLIDQNGIRAIIDSAMVAYERLPMLEIVFDRLVRLLTTSLRNFTSDNVEVTLDSLSSVRFGDYLNSIPLPAILALFKAKQWDNFGMVTVGSNLIYSMIDVLLGGGRGGNVRVEGRPYTTIETSLMRRMIEIVLRDAEHAFRPVSHVNFQIDRIETNPRFASIASPANAAILVCLRIDMEDRGGNVEIVLPYATIEPIRNLLLQMFMGEKFGRDSIWEGHLSTQIWSAKTEIEAVLCEKYMPISKVYDLKVGDTLSMDVGPEDLVNIRVGSTALTSGSLGKIDDKIAVKIEKPLRRPKMTLKAFEEAER